MLAITNAHILPIDGPEIAAGTILIDGSTIAAVGNGVAVPSDAEVIDAGGQLALPGMLDAHTHLGIHEEGVGWEGSDTNESTDPVTPHVRALDGINPEELGLLDTAAHGVTTAVVLPGSANVVGGLGAIIKTSGRFVDRMVVKAECGLKVAFGENPKRVYGDRKQLPATRMGVAAVLRETLVQAQVYLQKLERGAADPDKVPDRDLRLETVGRVLQREIPLLAHCHRADDILTVLRIAAEFEVDVILEHATEAHRIVEEIAARQVPCVVGPTFGARMKVELLEKTFASLGILAGAGVPVAICSDHPVLPSKYLRLYAGLAVAEGMTERDALRAITLTPAEIMGVADRVGSLTPGKDADIVLFDGHPLELRSRATTVIIDGQRVAAPGGEQR